jgi:hypothetical protein
VAHGFALSRSAAPTGALHVALPVAGPRLLVSAASTATQPMLRWRARVRRGQIALEFACLPDDATLLDDQCALHRRRLGAGGHAAAGFHTAHVFSSKLELMLPLGEGSCVELLARRGMLLVVITAPPPSHDAAQEGTRMCVRLLASRTRHKHSTHWFAACADEAWRVRRAARPLCCGWSCRSATRTTCGWRRRRAMIAAHLAAFVARSGLI